MPSTSTLNRSSAPSRSASASLHRQAVEAGLLAPDAPDVDATVVAIYGLLARTPSLLRWVAIDDAVGAVERPNVPGTIDQHPNWRVPLPVTVETLDQAPLFAAVVATMRGRRDPKD